MTLREPITLAIVAILALGALINVGANKLTKEAPTVQVCERVNFDLTVCKTIPEAELEQLLEDGA